MTGRAALLVALLCAAAPAGAQSSASPGSVRGRVTYRGPAPVRQPLTVDVNTEVCAAQGPILGEQLMVGPDAALVGAVLVLVGVDPGAPPPPSAARAGKLDQRGCVFLPHVQSLTLGSDLVIGNDDPVTHNVHARVDGKTVFNLGMPLRGVFVTRRLKVAGVTSLACDSGHTWMSAYVVVVPHPFHATSGAAGEFQIGGVPPGKYTLRAWHERLGTLDVPVTVEAGRDTELVVELPPPPVPFDRAPPLDFAPRPELRAEATVDAPARPAPAEPEPAPAASSALSREVRRAQRDADLARGQASFGRHCAPCHGDAGDGLGEAIAFLRDAPRDLTRGEFEFTSVPSGELAREEDLVRTITEGLPGTDMPAWGAVLPPSERRAIARYVMSFSPRFLISDPGPAITIPEEPPPDPGSIARGRTLWGRFRCAQCHGPDGRADGVSKKLVDDWGEPIKAADLSRGVYKSGRLGRDLYRTLITGLAGTPMPAFADQMGPTETWDLVHFVQSLGR